MSLKLLVKRLQEINDQALDEPNEKFKKVLFIVRDFLVSAVGCKEYEISIMLKDRDDQVHFVLPIRMFGKGNSFPIHKSRITKRVIEQNKPILNNDTRETERLAMYERLKDAEKEILPIQKFIAVPLVFNDVPFGAMWINRRAVSFEKAGPDFNQQDIDKVNHYLRFISPHLFKLRPDKYC